MSSVQLDVEGLFIPEWNSRYAARRKSRPCVGCIRVCFECLCVQCEIKMQCKVDVAHERHSEHKKATLFSIDFILFASSWSFSSIHN